MSDIAASPQGRLLTRLLPPRHAMTTAVKVAVVLIIPVSLALWAGGTDAAVLCALVIAVTVAQATTSYGGWQALFVLLTAIVAVAGSLIDAGAIGSAIFVGLAALLTYFGNRVSAGLLSLLPVIAVLLGLNIITVSAWTAGLVTLLAGAYTVIAVRLTRLRLPLRPVSSRIAITHAVVLAVLTGVITYLVATYNWPQGYWVVVTLAVVLRPSSRETTAMLRNRIIGTVIGSIIAVIIGALLPHDITWLVLVVVAWLQIANTLAHRYIAATVGSSMLIILAVAPAITGGVFEAAWERVAWTLFGSFLAIAAGLLLSDPEPEPVTN